MKNKTLGTAIDLCDLGLDRIDEDENELESVHMQPSGR